MQLPFIVIHSTTKNLKKSTTLYKILNQPVEKDGTRTWICNDKPTVQTIRSTRDAGNLTLKPTQARRYETQYLKKKKHSVCRSSAVLILFVSGKFVSAINEHEYRHRADIRKMCTLKRSTHSCMYIYYLCFNLPSFLKKVQKVGLRSLCCSCICVCNSAFKLADQIKKK
jgi:hypothetical protein